MLREHNPISTADVVWYPTHPMLVQFSTACFLGAFITDLTYWRTVAVTWETFSVWLLTAGLVIAGLAVVAGVVDYFGGRKSGASGPGWVYVVGNVVVVGLSIVNAFVHSRDGYTAVVPTGLILSGLVVLILIFTGWIGWRMVYRHRVGVAG